MPIDSAHVVPDTMQAIVLDGPNDWSLETIDTPTLDEVENVVCKVRAAALCGSDRHLMTGSFGDLPPRYPFIPGHEWAGEVVAVGEEVDRLGIGDRIFAESHHGCGFCRRCRLGLYNLCEHYGDFDAGHRQTGLTMDGAFAEYVSVPADTLYPLDEKLSYAEATQLDTSAIALWGTERGDIEAGDTVAVVGTGPIGLFCLQHAKGLGAGTLIAVGNPRRNEVAAQLGADHTISYRDDTVVDQVLELTEGTGVDVAIEAAGVPSAIQQAADMTAWGGTVSLLGIPSDETVPVPIRELVLGQIDLHCARAHANRAEPSQALAVNGRVDIESLITHRFDFTDFERAWATFTDDEAEAIKVVLSN